MARYSQPPAELAQAIAQAAQQYGVPPDVLTGIWRVESGSSYPNPYVNSSGYGGLFGTRNWNASTQDQANLSASILAQNIRASHGDISAALYSYSGHGYTSVPGQTTTGTWSGTTGQAFTGPSGNYTQPSRPDGSGTEFASFGGALLGGLEAPWKSLWGAARSAGDVAKVFAFLLQPRTWLRAFEAAVGTAFILLGLYFLGRGGEDSAELPTNPSTLLRGARRIPGPTSLARAVR